MHVEGQSREPGPLKACQGNINNMQGLKQTELCRALGQIEEKHSTISMILCTSKNDEHEIKSKKTN